MTPIPLTETQMAELFRLRAENAALKEQNGKLTLLSDTYFIERNSARDAYRRKEETIVQQAAVIEQMRDLLNGALETRDRKRDAKLLRLLADELGQGVLHPDGLRFIAGNRESGEWIPSLELKGE